MALSFVDLRFFCKRSALSKMRKMTNRRFEHSKNKRRTKGESENDAHEEHSSQFSYH